jgi:quercetin dioxygenase-like cupin family protein
MHKAQRVFFTIVAVALLAGAQAQDRGAATPPVSAAPLLTQPLAGVEGKEVTMLTVSMAPGAESPAHRHNASTYVYVLEGSVVMQVKDGKPVTLNVGQTFYESPTDIHTVSRNASKTAPAKILVFMVKNVGAPISEPVR